MIALLKIFPDKWEQAKGYLRLDLEAIESALNQRWSAAFGSDNVLQPGIIPEATPGDAEEDSRYVSNQGDDHTLLWDRVDLSNGVKNLLPFSSLVAATVPSTLVGRGSSSAGDFEEIVLGSGLAMHGQSLDVDLARLAGSIPIPDEPLQDDPWPIFGPPMSLPAPQTYTETNVVADRAFDANATTLDELADVLGTLIADLRARGVVA